MQHAPPERTAERQPVPLTFYVDPRIKLLLAERAQRNERSLSGELRLLLREGLGEPGDSSGTREP
jgi:hypothetical protein